MEKLIEKQKFYISEFREEAAWLAFMHREGWKFISTDGYHYEFEKCDKEDYIYQLDFKEVSAANEDYIQMFLDYGWEIVFHFRNWFYFRKKRMDEEEDLLIFSDNDSKIDMCRRVINKEVLQKVPLFLALIIFEYMILYTKVFDFDGFLKGLFRGIAIGVVCVIIICFGMIIGQYSRLNKMIKNMRNPIRK